MSHVAESFKHNGYTVEIILDEDGYSCNPRDNETNLFLFLGLPHRSYKIGDETFDPEDFEECYDPETDRLDLERTIAFLKDDHKSEYVVPVGMIDHSGVTYYIGGGAHWSDSQGWDSGTCGFMVLLPAKVTEHMGEGFEVTEEWAKEAATAELAEYAAWAAGEVYGVVIEDVNGKEVESLWGMIGMDYAEESAHEMVESLGEQPAKVYALRLTEEQWQTVHFSLHANGSPAAEALAPKVLDLIQEIVADNA